MTTDTIFQGDVPSVTDATDGTNYTMGTQFIPNGNWWATKVRWYAPLTSPGATLLPVQWQIWDEFTTTILASGVLGSITPGAWNEVALGAPLHLTSGKTYIVSGVSDRYTNTGHYFDAGVTRTLLSTPVSAGKFTDIGSSTTPAMPTAQFASGAYFWDVTLTDVDPGSGGSQSSSGTITGHNTISAAVSRQSVVTGTVTGHNTLSSSTAKTVATAGTIAGHGSLGGVASGGDVDIPLGADYDIGEIMDALATTFNGVPTGQLISGIPQTMMASAEVIGAIEPPAIVFELDDQELNLDMAAGADQLNVTGLVLVTYADSDGAQRALWSFLSRKRSSGLFRLYAALEANQSLGGLVSYAIIKTVRNIGIITYSGVDYLGAELVIEVVS